MYDIVAGLRGILESHPACLACGRRYVGQTETCPTSTGVSASRSQRGGMTRELRVYENMGCDTGLPLSHAQHGRFVALAHIRERLFKIARHDHKTRRALICSLFIFAKLKTLQQRVR